MKILVLSDIHGNIDAVRAIDETLLKNARFDEVWVLGDLVDYGPAPDDVIAWVRAHATKVVRGNHDHAVGTGEDCRSSSLYHDLAVATREYFRPRMSAEGVSYLAALSLRAVRLVDRTRRALLVHATPQEPLFQYVRSGAPMAAWQAAIADVREPFVCVGHTHEQFVREIDGITLLNPGSVGLPKDGDPRAACAILEDGAVTLLRIEYDVACAVSRIRSLALGAAHRDRLVHLIEHASLE